MTQADQVSQSEQTEHVEEKKEKRKTVGQAFLEALLSDSSPDDIKAFLRAVQKPVVKHTRVDKERQNGPVVQYTTVIKKSTCLICGATTRTQYEMKKGEQMSTIDPDGKCHLITVSGKSGTIEIPSTVSRCEFCTKLVKHWDREELENNFLLLLSSMSFREKSNYAKARRLVLEEGVIRL